MNTKTYEVYDRRYGRVTGQFSSLKAAYRYADRADAEYGAVVCTVRRIK